MAINNEPTIQPRTVTGIFTNYIAKVLPLAFDDSMSYYECLCALLNYINDTIVPDINNTNDGLGELQVFYEELQSYVNNYFDNLDVQDEINNKLDQMVMDGTLQAMLDEKLSDIQETINSQFTIMNNKIDAIENLNPIPVTSTSSMTDTEKIYLNVTDGYWYYYNGENWVQGGEYQTAEDSTTLSQIENYFTVINLLLKGYKVNEGAVYTNTGLIEGGASNRYLYIPIIGGTKYYISKTISTYVFAVCTTADTPTFHSTKIDYTANGINNNNPITLQTSASANYLCVQFYNTGQDSAHTIDEVIGSMKIVTYDNKDEQYQVLLKNFVSSNQIKTNTSNIATNTANITKTTDFNNYANYNEYQRYLKHNSFKWNTFTGGLVSICFDDLRHDLSTVYSIFEEYDIPLCVCAIGSDTYLETTLDSGVKAKVLLPTIQTSGGEILSHSINGTPWSNDTTLTESFNRLVESKEKLENLGLNVNGFCVPGGGSLTWLDNFMFQIYGAYLYADNGSSVLQDYHLPRTSMATRDLSTLTNMIDDARFNNKWHRFLGHTLDGTESGMTEAKLRGVIEYCISHNVPIVTFKYVYDNYGSYE